MRFKRHPHLWALAVVSMTSLGCAAVAPPTPSPDGGTADAGGDGAHEALVRAIDGPMLRAVDPQASSDLTRCPSAIAVVVTRREQLVRGYGAARDGQPVPPHGSTIFQLGSVTKVFTGLVLARLVVGGQMREADTAGPHLAADLRPSASWSDPTLRDLVSHYAGFPSMPSNLQPADPASPAAGYTRADLRAYLEQWTPLSPRQYRYSNVGIGLLGNAIQDQLGLATFEAVVRSLVTTDLAMRDTWGNTDAIPALAASRQADGHLVKAGRWTAGKLARMGALASAGEMASTGEDMRAFLEALTGLKPTPLDAAIERALTPIGSGPTGADVGYAINVEHRASMDVYFKPGNTPSFGAFVIFSRATPAGVAVLASCGAPFPVHELGREVFDSVLPLAAE